MSFCWFTSFIGYPNFFRPGGRGADLARAFVTLGEAAEAGTRYGESKKLFPRLDPHQVETKKAAFQEFGLLYVVPRSDTLTLTPLGRQILELCVENEQIEKNRRTILLTLARGLARYQFNNPLPVGGNKEEKRIRAQSSDVLPYLACYYLLHKLDGILAANELRGAIFGLQKMSNLRMMEDRVRRQRATGKRFEDLPGLPRKRGTADNLKIYFLSHLSLDSEIMKPSRVAALYAGRDQFFEVTELGFEVIESVLDTEWPGWRSKTSTIPRAQQFTNLQDYFSNGVGQRCSDQIIALDDDRVRQSEQEGLQQGLNEKDLSAIKEWTRQEFKEGRKRFIQHSRLETVRNPRLVQAAKVAFKERHGTLFCEACQFNFETRYGERGRNYMEAHHRTPISTLSGEVKLRINDLVMVCSNCHRMLHRDPWITVEQLQGFL